MFVWDLEKGTVAAAMKSAYTAYGMACSKDGKRIFAAGTNNGITAWDASTGLQVAELAGHQRAVLDLALSPDGSCLVSASEDTTLLVWDAAGATVADPAAPRE